VKGAIVLLCEVINCEARTVNISACDNGSRGTIGCVSRKEPKSPWSSTGVGSFIINEGVIAVSAQHATTSERLRVAGCIYTPSYVERLSGYKFMVTNF
jgi:hypothetical protein